MSEIQNQPEPTAPGPAPASAWYPPPTLPPSFAPSPHARHPWRWIAAGTIAATILAAGGGVGMGWTLAQLLAPHATQSAQTATQQAAQAPATAESPIVAVTPANGSTGAVNISAVTAKVSPAIVDIYTVIESSTGAGSAAGTGMIVTSSGEILTNNHVVDQSTSIRVTIAGRGTYPAHVIGVSPTADVALIQVEGVSGLPTVTLADTSSLKVGNPVVALGNALGQGGAPSVTQGAITALDQTVTASEGGGRSETLNGMVQFSASISPGDSGGALANAAGQVIGMITAGEAQGFSSNSTNIAYSITTNDALTVVNEIRAGQASALVIIGPVGYIGVSIRDLDAQTAAQLGLSVTSGALVWSVLSGSPAEQAGIAKYSVITQVGNTTVSSSDELGAALHAFKPGAKVAITWIAQNGGTHTATLTLISGPNI